MLIHDFPPTHAAALQRIAAIVPRTYAATRNALDGDVTGLSPYLTHGVISVADVVRGISAAHTLGYKDKIVFELAWREFFQHVWSHMAACGQPNALLADIRTHGLWAGQYANDLPADIRSGASGVPAIDAAVRQLYTTGYLHNHARMWLASYCIHLRKVHWRAGADWMIGHLLDGDLASNHLSWQWVAGTFSSKPYLFNADNIAKYAPPKNWKNWHSPRTVVDASYEQLDYIARHSASVGAQPGHHAKVDEPEMLTDALQDFIDHFFVEKRTDVSVERSYDALKLIVNNRPRHEIELVHPWALTQRSTVATWRIGMIHLPAHVAQPWSRKRWNWVLTRMADVVDEVWVGDLAQFHKQQQSSTVAVSIKSTACLSADYRDWLALLGEVLPADRFFAAPVKACHSFSQFYERSQKLKPDFSSLISGQKMLC